MSKRDTYISKMKSQLDELNRSMEGLENKAQDAKVEAKEKYNEELAKLRAQSKLAVAKLEELTEASEDNWDTMTASMEKVRDAFTHSFHYFRSQLKA